MDANTTNIILSSRFVDPADFTTPRDVRARTLLSTCHSMHYLVASAAVLSGQVLLPKEPSRATSAGTPIHTTAEVRPQAEEADSVKPLCLLLRATARGYPEQGAACLPALLSGDEIVVGKELLVAERCVSNIPTSRDRKNVIEDFCRLELGERKHRRASRTRCTNFLVL